MSDQLPAPQASNTFERIKRVNAAGAEFWSARELARVLEYTNFRNFEGVVEKARTACFTSGQRVEDHFVEINEMIEIGKGGQRPVKTIMLSRYAGYLVIQNADPTKALVARRGTSLKSVFPTPPATKRKPNMTPSWSVWTRRGA